MSRAGFSKQIAFTGALSLCSFNAIAADEIENMLVRASRIPVEKNLMGGAYTIIDDRKIRNRQTAFLSEILRAVPGFSINRGGPLGSLTQLRVRGGEANQVMVLIDGVQANDLAQGDEFNFAHLLTDNIKKVEVIRGPQSALWGSDALTGVVNILTAKGRGPVSLEGHGEGGSLGSAYGGGSISGSGQRYDFHLGGAILGASGINLSRAGDEEDGYANATLSFSLGYQPDEALHLRFSGRHTGSRSDFDGISPLTGLPADANNKTRASQDYARIAAELDPFAGAWKHQIALALTGSENDNFTDDVETSSTQGRKYKIDYQSSLFFKTSGLFDTTHAAVFAIEYEKEQFTQRGIASAFGDPNQDQAVDSTAYIGEYRLTLNEKIALSGAVRRDDNSDFQPITTYRITGAFFQPEAGTRLYANHGTGSKNPTFTERFGFFARSLVPFFGNAALKPETSRAWEIGLEQSSLEGKLKLGLHYFDEELKNEIQGATLDPVTRTRTAVNTDGRSKRHGIEITASLLLSDALDINGHYTYLDATEPDASGRQIDEVRRPRHIGNLNLNYAFLDNRANVNLDIHFTGHQLDVFFPPPSFAEQRVVLDDFMLVTLAGSYQLHKNMSLYGRLENLLNEDYEEVLGFSKEGITAYMGMRVTFKPGF